MELCKDDFIDAATSACEKGIAWDEALQLYLMVPQNKMELHRLHFSDSAVEACERHCGRPGLAGLQHSDTEQEKAEHNVSQRC